MPVSIPGSVQHCAWCGLLTEVGPVCNICGSPVLDIAGRTTVLDVSWPMEAAAPPAPILETGPRWVSLEQVSNLFQIPEPSLRSWLPEAPRAGEPRLLLIEPGPQLATRPSDPIAVSAPDLLPPPMPDPPAWPEPAIAPEPEDAPSLWVAPAPAPIRVRLGDGWAFQPTDTERRAIRMEMLRTRGAAILAIGIGATGIVYLIDRVLA